MERQCFENPAIAALMNEHFVCIKVDREERPDVDDLYMTAVQLLTGRGGWPMSVFLIPPQFPPQAEDFSPGSSHPGFNLLPFYAGTYFPPTPAHGLPSFPDILTGIAAAWRDRREAVREQARRVGQAVVDTLTRRSDQGHDDPVTRQLSIASVNAAANALLGTFDTEHGGFAPAGPEEGPKFPQPANLQFLIAVHRNNDARASGESADVWPAIAHSLDRMARGGLCDQIGGGFHRYAVDRRWLVPHFEKMLYDNGQLLETYALAHELRPVANNPDFYADILRATADYLLREMVDVSGGGAFWSAQDAEVDAQEGGNYLWTADQVRAALAGDDEAVALALKLYGLDLGPNFQDPHHRDAAPVNVLFQQVTLPTLAQELNLPLDVLRRRKHAIDQRLLAIRNQRKQPITDDKVLTGWNGLAIAGLAHAGRVLHEPRYLDAAGRAARAVLDRMSQPDGGLFRTMRQNTAKIPAFLADYAMFIHGLLALALADVDRPGMLAQAARLFRYADDHFACSDAAPASVGGYFDTLADQPDLFVRLRSTYDGALPSGGSVMVHNLLDLFELTGERAYLDRAVEDLGAFAQHLQGQPIALIHMQHALLRVLELTPSQTTPRASSGKLPGTTPGAISGELPGVTPGAFDFTQPPTPGPVCDERGCHLPPSDA
jgi:uncharacterized protein YyaL (SSP411 family)